ncbi:MAG: hypothetical protein IKJ05_02500 [Oscillospiraceae bacterium]|nr:hypothetical protein [Oscillospiraceae bacterium]
MKITGKCPKCNSSQVLRFDGYHGGYGSGNHLVTSMFSSVNVNRYVCCSCGFTEEWIDTEDLDKVIYSKKAVKE